MSCILALDRRAKHTVEAPDWVGKAYEGAVPLGEGSYARVYCCADGYALKLTNDVATMNLARRLALAPTPGFYRVRRLSHLRRAPGPFMAVSMPILARVGGWRRASIAKAYKRALVQACRQHGYSGSTVRGARAFAGAMANATDEPLSSFSASICLHLAASMAPNEQGRSLRDALVSLAQFCEAQLCDIDLMGMDNWMLDDAGRLVLNDPVVHKALAF